jgi:hypothetical protein
MSKILSPISSNHPEGKTAIFFLLLLSTINIALFVLSNAIASLLLGQIIIILYVIDLLKTPFRFHIYQLLLFYFYYSLCITNAYSDFSNKDYNYRSMSIYADLGQYYNYGYLVNVVYFILFCVGYHSLKYKHGIYVIKKKQNLLVGLFFLYVVITIIAQLLYPDNNNSGSYSERFTMSAAQGRENTGVIDYISNAIYGFVSSMILFSFSNPLVYSFYIFITSTVGYVLSGIKADIIGSTLSIIFLYQVYYKKITIKRLLYLFPISLFLVIVLISTTSFRSELTLNNLLNVSYGSMTSFLKFFLISPESSHIIYTADIIKKIDLSVIDFRYGFDYIKFFLYPFKEIFSEFGYSSFVEYVHIISGEKVSQGLYLGMAGELFWNFGPFFVLPAYLLGVILKLYTNWVFSLSLNGVISYIILGRVIVWIYYRGIANELLINSLLYAIALFLFLVVQSGSNHFNNKKNI